RNCSGQDVWFCGIGEGRFRSLRTRVGNCDRSERRAGNESREDQPGCSWLVDVENDFKKSRRVEFIAFVSRLRKVCSGRRGTLNQPLAVRSWLLASPCRRPQTS